MRILPVFFVFWSSKKSLFGGYSSKKTGLPILPNIYFLICERSHFAINSDFNHGEFQGSGCASCATSRCFGYRRCGGWMGSMRWHPGAFEGWRGFDSSWSYFGGCKGARSCSFFADPSSYQNVSEGFKALATHQWLAHSDRETVFQKQTSYNSRTVIWNCESKLEGEKVLWICQNEDSQTWSEHSY